jgi:hypothetical protein
VADRGYFSGEEIVACDRIGITVTLPKPMTSGAKSEGRFGKQDSVYLPEEDVYRCPAGERLKYYYTNVENGLKLRRYWTNACRTCALKSRCTTAVQRRITRWEHEHVLEAVQRRLNENPQASGPRLPRDAGSLARCDFAPSDTTSPVLAAGFSHGLEPKRHSVDTGLRARHGATGGSSSASASAKTARQCCASDSVAKL